MSDRSVEQLADTVEIFVARVETYETLLEDHRSGRVSTEQVERYIGDGLTDDAEGLVDTWIEAEEAAEQLREYDSDQEYGMDASERPQRPTGPKPPTIHGSPGLDLEREEQASELWQTFYDAAQTISEHESYALSEFDRSPVEYRMGIDADYRERLEDI